MEYSRLGASGLQVSRVCLGMMSFGSKTWQPWVAGREEGLRLFRLALDRGINFFDTADFYSWGESEDILGEAVSASASRHDVVIATKVGLPMTDGPNRGGLSRKHVLSAVDGSLKRLRTDYIDLYQIHKWDENTPIEETLGAFDDVVRAGKARYIGISNCAAWQLVRAQCIAKASGQTQFTSVQAQYNLAYREDEREILPYCIADGLGVIGYSPLARGWLAGARDEKAPGLSAHEALRAKSDAKGHHLYGSAGDIAVRERVRELAAGRAVPMARVAMAWILGHSFMSSLIIGAMEEKHLDEAVTAIGLRLPPEDMTRLEEVYLPQSVKDDAMRVALGR